jgi:hypothetical protein
LAVIPAPARAIVPVAAVVLEEPQSRRRKAPLPPLTRAGGRAAVCVPLRRLADAAVGARAALQPLDVLKHLRIASGSTREGG